MCAYGEVNQGLAVSVPIVGFLRKQVRVVCAKKWWGGRSGQFVKVSHTNRTMTLGVCTCAVVQDLRDVRIGMQPKHLGCVNVGHSTDEVHVLLVFGLSGDRVVLHIDASFKREGKSLKGLVGGRWSDVHNRTSLS